MLRKKQKSSKAIWVVLGHSETKISSVGQPWWATFFQDLAQIFKFYHKKTGQSKDNRYLAKYSWKNVTDALVKPLFIYLFIYSSLQCLNLVCCLVCFFILFVFTTPFNLKTFISLFDRKIKSTTKFPMRVVVYIEQISTVHDSRYV